MSVIGLLPLPAQTRGKGGNELGGGEESLSRILHAEAVEPLALSIGLSMGRCYIYARRFDPHCPPEERARPPLTMLWVARTLCALDRPFEAIDLSQRLPAEDHTPYVHSVLAQALAAAGQVNESRAICGT